jgi:aerobic carbon-monoxide dehydrogenase small subunit
MQTIALRINGETVQAQVEPRMHLGDFLRETQRLTGTHLGCEHGVCGACTVLLDGAPSRSCIAYAVACEGREVRTIEGFGDDTVMEQLRAAFHREHALQCGFCTPGMLIAARDLVLRLPDADEARVRVEMSGNICRCTGYRGIVRAILSVLGQRRAVNDAFVETAPAAKRPAFQPFEAGSVTEQQAIGVARGPAAGPLGGGGSGSAGQEARSGAGGTLIEEVFSVAYPLERVWEIFGDMPAVAACLPGAEIAEYTADALKGKVTARFGPMRAVFAGSATLERDATVWRGTIRGSGTDNLSGSRARGDISYQLFDAGGGYTQVTVAIDYSLQGPLAQFSRGGLVKAFVKKMVADFGVNLNRRLGQPAGAGQATPIAPASSADAASVFWRWIWERIRAIFREK